MNNLNITESFVARKASYNRFAKIQHEIVTCSDDEIILNIDIQNRFGYTFLFLFCTLPYLSEKYNKKIEIYCNEKTYKLLVKLNYLKRNIEFSSTLNICPLLQENIMLIKKKEDIFNLVTEITYEAPVAMSEQLSSIFISMAGEMYNNASEHSGGDVLGAKYFKNQKNTYCFTCYDTGIGIPYKVLNSVHEIHTQLEAFAWAMICGNSTVNSNIPRGVGLSLLQSFAKANEGTIRICSNKILYVYNKRNGIKYYELDSEFYGTLFEMDIIADNNKEYIIR